MSKYSGPARKSTLGGKAPRNPIRYAGMSVERSTPSVKKLKKDVEYDDDETLWSYYGSNLTTLNNPTLSNGRKFVVLNLTPSKETEKDVNRFRTAFLSDSIDAWIVVEPARELTYYDMMVNDDFGLAFLPDVVYIDFRVVHQNQMKEMSNYEEKDGNEKAFDEKELYTYHSLKDRVGYVTGTASKLSTPEKWTVRSIFAMLLHFDQVMNFNTHGYRPTVIMNSPKNWDGYNECVRRFVEYCSYKSIEFEVDQCCFGANTQRATVVWHHPGQNKDGLEWATSLGNTARYKCKWCRQEEVIVKRVDIPHSEINGWPGYMCPRRILGHADGITPVVSSDLPAGFYEFLSRKIGSFFVYIDKHQTEVLPMKSFGMSRYKMELTGGVDVPYRFMDWWLQKKMWKEEEKKEEGDSAKE